MQRHRQGLEVAQPEIDIEAIERAFSSAQVRMGQSEDPALAEFWERGARAITKAMGELMGLRLPRPDGFARIGGKGQVEEASSDEAIQQTAINNIQISELFSSLEIRDQAVHRPPHLAHLQKVSKWFYYVENSLDQAVTLTTIGSLFDDSNAGDTGTSTAVAAGARESIIADEWTLWQGLRAECGADPTSGSLTITAVGQV